MKRYGSPAVKNAGLNATWTEDYTLEVASGQGTTGNNVKVMVYNKNLLAGWASTVKRVAQLTLLPSSCLPSCALVCLLSPLELRAIAKVLLLPCLLLLSMSLVCRWLDWSGHFCSEQWPSKSAPCKQEGTRAR